MTISELSGLSARQLAKAIAGGQLSAIEATEAAIARATQVNPALNAFLSLEADAALSAAHAFDASGRRGEFPLGGVPLAHKDMFDRAGKIATWGANIRATTPAARDATVIERLAKAGSISLGTLNLAEFAFGITGHNYCVGHCRNPHNPAHITGGSSSGSAAAVASGVVPFALGSDTAGSVRVPASCCGITGLRPTWGLVSRAGAMPLAPSFDTIGILARDVGDIALGMSIIAGPDPRDGGNMSGPNPDFDKALDASPKGLRIGVDRALLATVHPEVAALLEASLAMLLEAGAVEVPVTMPDLGQIDEYARMLQLPEASSMHADTMRTRPQDYSDQVRARLQDGFAISAVDYLHALRARPLFANDMLSGPLGSADVLFLPVLGQPVPTIAETDVGGSGSLAEMLATMLRFTRPLSYFGFPSLTLPTAKDARGLPNGFQLVGRPFAETTLLSLGSAYQRATGIPVPVTPPI